MWLTHWLPRLSSDMVSEDLAAISPETDITAYHLRCPSVAYQYRPSIEAKIPGGIVPINVLCYPTPIYEFIACVIIFYVLWRLRKRMKRDGKLFMLYLMLEATERFTVEFIRLNPRLLFGLSEARLWSISLMLIGLTGFFYLYHRQKQNEVVSVNR